MSAPDNRDPQELAHFNQKELNWWDLHGPLRTLHAINPARLQYIEMSGSLNGKQVLDVGCGGGILSEAMAQRGAQVMGIDLAEQPLQQAREHAEAQDLTLDYQQLDVHTLAGDSPERFDLVTCMELLEHVPDFPALLADCACTLRPGGSLIVSTLNRTPAAFALAILAGEHLLRLVPVGTHHYEQFIRPRELAQAARECGLNLEDIQGMNYNPLSHTAKLSSSTQVNYLMRLHRV